jgi:hypothetical protein
VLAAARALAAAEGRTVGQVISELVRRGLEPRRHEASEDAFPVFSVPPDAAPITLETVARALEDDG